MSAILWGFVIGVLVGAAYLFAREADVRRTLISWLFLGVAVGVLVELARQPWLGALVAVMATMVVGRVIVWMFGGMIPPPPGGAASMRANSKGLRQRAGRRLASLPEGLASVGWPSPEGGRREVVR